MDQACAGLENPGPMTDLGAATGGGNSINKLELLAHEAPWRTSVWMVFFSDGPSAVRADPRQLTKETL